MMDRTHNLPVSHQCLLLGLARSSAYYTPREVSPEDLALMRRIDELHLEHPFAGTRMLPDLLRREGFQAGRRHIGTLMARMGIEALYRKPNTSRRQRGDEIHPYLLRDLAVDRANQVWAADITYIPMRRGFLYLFAVIDWYSRRVLAWRLSNTLTTRLLSGRGAGSHPPARLPGDLQHRSGLPVHQRRIHGSAQGARHPDQHGRQGVLAG